MATATLPEENPTVGSLLQMLRQSFNPRFNQCEEARFVVADLPLHRDRAQEILPFGLRLADPPTGTLFVVDYRRPAFCEPYLEAAFLVHVRTVLGRGLHCCWIVVDNDTPMIYGRETLAYPKKMAELRFEETGDTVVASVRRRGVEVLSLQARRTGPLDDPDPIFGATTYNVGGIGEVLGLQPIWRFRLKERVRESYRLDLALTLRDSAFDPVARLVAGEPRQARMVIEDIAGAQTMLPVGFTGPKWLARTFYMRYR